jgi:hypothetical protein
MVIGLTKSGIEFNWQLWHWPLRNKPSACTRHSVLVRFTFMQTINMAAQYFLKLVDDHTLTWPLIPVTLNFETRTWSSRMTFCLTDVYNRAKYKQDCSMHVKVMVRTSSDLISYCDLDHWDGNLSLRETLCLIKVNSYYTKYEQNCSMRVTFMSRTRSDIIYDPPNVTLNFEIGTWGLSATLRLTEVKIHVRYKQDCSVHVIISYLLDKLWDDHWLQMLILTFEMWTWGLRATLCLNEVNIHASYKQDCSVHVKVIGRTSPEMTFDP